jgi:PAS domain S-box-containing protein
MGKAKDCKGSSGRPRGKPAGEEQEANVCLLRLINQASGTADLAEAALDFFREQARCQSVGIRLEEGGDYPFYAARGYPADFIREENSLLERGGPGACPGGKGNPRLACLCGCVLCGRPESLAPSSTAGGSVRIDDLAAFSAAACGACQPPRIRSACRLAGTRSLALIPLRSGEKILGMLHFADPGKGLFPGSKVALWERLAGHLATALAKTRAEEAHLRAEESVRKSEARLRILFAQAADAIVLIDPETLAIVDFNDRACQQLGYTRAEFAKLALPDIEVVETADEIRRHSQCVIADGISVFETRQRAKNGELRCVEVRTSPVGIGDQRLIQSFWIDITDRKREELALVEALAKSRELETIINRSPSMAFRWKTEPGFPVVFVSSNVSQLGYTADDFLSGRVSWISATHPEDVPRLERELAEHEAAGRDVFMMEYRLFHRDGRVRAMSDYTHALRWPDGRIAFYESVITDVTERKQAEEVLRQTARDLARSNKDLEQFAYVVSHDLQEPLRMVTSFLSLLQEKCRGRLDEAAEECIRYSADGAGRMAELIRDLLAYSRVSVKGIEPKPVALAAVMEHVKVMLRNSIDEVNAAISSDPLPVVHADPGQVGQLLQNLVGNALKFRRKNRRPKVHVGARREGAEWVLSVTDNGIGIEPQYAGKLFQLFQRLHTRQEYPGTGIGLAICQKIVERHGGRIWVESEPDKGSVFWFTLPAGRDAK